MEHILLIIAMGSFALSVSIFIMDVLKNGLKGYGESKSTRFASIFFLIYVVTFASFLFVFN
ncbi:hypothetical protein [Metabacillus halosaccharovorans]|uniref:hypothetical protein n=1 Tax=Metabacillus halosaccharovorans TaxID=930124 RepID=UPI001C1F3D10|nr:hypothetical protein [Metabacillus halosaccharovorans]MBU7592555.1 hypothetical protein [Metabacillus halosaccharovorans]